MALQGATVDISIDGNFAGTLTLDANGQASGGFGSNYPAGSHQVTAHFNGVSGQDNPSDAAPVTQQINPTVRNTQTVLATNPNPSTQGQSFTASVTVTEV